VPNVARLQDRCRMPTHAAQELHSALPFQPGTRIPKMPRAMASERARQIGERIKARREQLQLTQEELARKTEAPAITGNVISRWERGSNRPSQPNLEALANALEVAEGYLTFGNERPAPVPAAVDGQLLDRLAGIEARLGELVDVFRGATAPGIETLVQAALRDLGVDPATLPRTSPADQPPAAPARKPPRRRRQANG
jgi:transcriptional regulator with XRE-family HTH domain